MEDAGQEEQLDLRLGYDADGNLWSNYDSGICLHGLAVLLAYGTAGDVDGQFNDALTAAIEECTKRGRTEVRLKSLSGEPWFSTWRARSIAAAGSICSISRPPIRFRSVPRPRVLITVPASTSRCPMIDRSPTGSDETAG